MAAVPLVLIVPALVATLIPAVRAMRDGDTHYTHSLGLPELREAIAAWYYDQYRVSVSSEQIVVTADSVILDRCARWANLARAIVSARVPEAWIVDVGDGAVMRR